MKESRFSRAVEVILRHEGGYVNHPSDPGGETNFGISKRAFPNEDIKSLTKRRAKELYFEYYWRPLNLHLLNSDLLALHIFDMAVNAGAKTAVKLLQRTVGTVEDGALGRITARYALCRPNVTEEYIEARKEHYINLARKNPKLKVFLRGWMNRVENTVL